MGKYKQDLIQLQLIKGFPNPVLFLKTDLWKSHFGVGQKFGEIFLKKKFWALYIWFFFLQPVG